jgi:hypothetical protein
MFLCTVLYMLIFFRLWWGVIFGAISNLAALPRVSVGWEELFIALYFILFQYCVGLQPALLNWTVTC